ncbi:hypothetical protein [Streptomyces sp. DSM 40750]|uniref:hypothetical protein n=1 Tax=Streptomyces sp. DSM 40750 TaxID=2801030 RepID=UPI00214CCBBF|nr:hypothetical protein [Streptomyces sp. DSM 40750]UUU24414.1 hypothetical protein JIX55_31485 [Streptomyces sp. DSM 40750]
MIRYVNFQFRTAIPAWIALLCTMGAFLAVHGDSELPDWWWRAVAYISATHAVLFRLRLTRIRFVSTVRQFDEAPPRPVPYGTWSTDYWGPFHRPRSPFVVRALVLMALVLPLCLLWEPYPMLGLLWVTLEWTSLGLIASRWEFESRALLWLGRQGRDPEEYYYTTVSPR